MKYIVKKFENTAALEKGLCEKITVVEAQNTSEAFDLAYEGEAIYRIYKEA